MLEGKIALVTGAGRGIGRQIALSLASEGAAVAVNYCGSREKAEETVSEIERFGGKAFLCPCNVADYGETEEMLQTVLREFGRLDILVNNAGITKDNLVMRMSEAEFDAVLAVNLKGTFHTIRHAAKQMIRQKSGRIINISSVSGVLGNAGQANYAASKAGVIGLTKTVARELAGRGITANAIAPGFVETDMTAVLSPGVREAAIAMIPQRRFGRPEDIADMVCYLASEKAAYITGQVISIDGGMAI